MADILTYVLHYEGAFNKNSLGGVSEAARLASPADRRRSARARPRRRGRPDRRAVRARSADYGATKVFRVKGPEGLAQPVVDAMAKVIDDNGHDYALFGGGLLGFEIGAGLAARKQGGVTAWRSRRVNVEDGKLVAEHADPPGLADLRGRATRAAWASSSAA